MRACSPIPPHVAHASQKERSDGRRHGLVGAESVLRADSDSACRSSQRRWRSCRVSRVSPLRPRTAMPLENGFAFGKDHRGDPACQLTNASLDAAKTAVLGL